MDKVEKIKRKNSPPRSKNRMILKILLWPIILVDRVYHRLLFAISSRRTFDGFTLYSIHNDIKFFEQVIEALKLLRKIAPLKYERVRKYMPVIAHVTQGMNFYKQSARAFYVQEYGDDVAYFSSEVVHEATHAYLLAKGFRYIPKARERHERICTKQQLGFISKVIRSQQHLSDSQQHELIEQWKNWFDEQLASHWWHDKKIRKKQLGVAKDLLKGILGIRGTGIGNVSSKG